MTEPVDTDKQISVKNAADHYFSTIISSNPNITYENLYVTYNDCKLGFECTNQELKELVIKYAKKCSFINNDLSTKYDKLLLSRFRLYMIELKECKVINFHRSWFENEVLIFTMVIYKNKLNDN